jgi:hypothetical protein
MNKYLGCCVVNERNPSRSFRYCSEFLEQTPIQKRMFESTMVIYSFGGFPHSIKRIPCCGLFLLGLNPESEFCCRKRNVCFWGQSSPRITTAVPNLSSSVPPPPSPADGRSDISLRAEMLHVKPP